MKQITMEEIIAKIVADPMAAAQVLCDQEEKLIAAEKEIKRLEDVLAVTEAELAIIYIEKGLQ